MFPISYKASLLQSILSRSDSYSAWSRTAPIKSVRTTQITLLRSDFRSARSSKGDVCRGGSVRLFSSNLLTQKDRGRSVEK